MRISLRLRIYLEHLFYLDYRRQLALRRPGVPGKLPPRSAQGLRTCLEMGATADLPSSAKWILLEKTLLDKPAVAPSGNQQAISKHVLGIILCFLYLFAGAFRLVRFNVQAAGDRSKGYQGLPIPISAMSLASLVIFKYQSVLIVEPFIWFLLLLFLSVLMVSHIYYNWPQLNFGGRLKDRLISISVCVAIVLMALFPRYLLFPLLTVYVIKGIAGAFIHLLHRWHILPVPLSK